VVRIVSVELYIEYLFLLFSLLLLLLLLQLLELGLLDEVLLAIGLGLAGILLGLLGSLLFVFFLLLEPCE
jgi:hypothetical protein